MTIDTVKRRYTSKVLWFRNVTRSTHKFHTKFWCRNIKKTPTSKKPTRREKNVKTNRRETNWLRTESSGGFGLSTLNLLVIPSRNSIHWHGPKKVTRVPRDLQYFYQIRRFSCLMQLYLEKRELLQPRFAK